MRDPVRNLKNIFARPNRDSDSDESQPLLSTSCSSASSFGPIGGPPGFTSDSEEEDPTISPAFPKSSPISVSVLAQKDKYERHYIFGTFEPPAVEVYVANNNRFLFRDNSLTELAKFMNQNGKMNIQANSADQLKASPLPTEASFDKFMDYREPEKKTQSSLVTIFAIWNTTMGSSLLAMSWGIQMAGLFPGIAINIMVAALCLYTCHLLLTVKDKHGMPGLDIEVSHLCKDLLGKWAEVLAKIFSVVVLLGADIVYLILMSNFLYNSVYFIYGLITHPYDSLESNATVLCPKEMLLDASMSNSTRMYSAHLHNSVFGKIWDLYSTVPIFLAVIMFGVLNFKSPTFFTKFNSLGTFSVLYLLIFVAVKAYGWGINMPDWSSEIYLKTSFSALSGMLSLSYFIHNIIISVMRNNKHQENNGRDLSIAFGLITFTYLFIGILFYISFPLAKSCIEDNIFNNFSKNDTMTIIARILLMFQLFTVFPLISFMLRKDILSNINEIFRNYRFGDFTYGKVMVLNACVLVICVLFACFLPKIGTLIRYTGALSGMIYIFMLPNLLKIASLRKDGKLTITKASWHMLIILAGALNLLSQFFIYE
ncbi:unnamed protein product [Ceutorhynchus assimilis]|uniref:Amino acid transporter transmembrane domain-containing protein n=1 Tax=Ceutorhynchus assimilis TaxID=467358 RepID=A0A9P0DJF0_9CUCU|nr:unnamed protein product [Ceutorhynchus assimilis]